MLKIVTFLGILGCLEVIIEPVAWPHSRQSMHFNEVRLHKRYDSEDTQLAKSRLHPRPLFLPYRFSVKFVLWWLKFDILLNTAPNRMLVTKSESHECPLPGDMLVYPHRIPTGPAAGPACQKMLKSRFTTKVLEVGGGEGK